MRDVNRVGDRGSGSRGVRSGPGRRFEGSGVSGDPTRASAEYGEMGMELRVGAAVRQIRGAIGGG